MKETTVVNLACGTLKCTDHLSLHVETEHHAYGLTGGHINAALEKAATHLGWRMRVDPRDTNKNVVCCPFHAKDLRCARCPANAHECVCMGGPRWEALP